uniref:Ig-like domain-containing protein n=1 Tax=Kryptolebias marmoratus TaxID=37003 RepID=A0A3Q3AQ51_KRYMA
PVSVSGGQLPARLYVNTVLMVTFIFIGGLTSNSIVLILTTHTPPVEPSFLQISSIPQIPQVERLLVLCCRVENFYPKNVDLEWSRSDGERVVSLSHIINTDDLNKYSTSDPFILKKVECFLWVRDESLPQVIVEWKGRWLDGLGFQPQ